MGRTAEDDREGQGCREGGSGTVAETREGSGALPAGDEQAPLSDRQGRDPRRAVEIQRGSGQNHAKVQGTAGKAEQGVHDAEQVPATTAVARLRLAVPAQATLSQCLEVTETSRRA